MMILLIFANIDAAAMAAGHQGYDIIVVAGQSNAVGAGLGPFADPLEDASIDAKIMQIGRVGPDNMQLILVGHTVNGVKYDGLQHWGMTCATVSKGFALAFARHYVHDQLAPNRLAVIVPAARGGSSILDWLGETSQIRPSSPSLPLYADMIARVRAAQALPGENRVVAFLWHQGETDANFSANPKAQNVTGMTPRLYEEKLTRLIRMIRRDIAGSYPVVMGTFVPDWVPNWPDGERIKAEIEQAIKNVASRDNMAGVALSAGLQSNYTAGASPSPAQKVHFSAASSIDFGSRYYETWKRLKEARSRPVCSSHTKCLFEH